MCASYAPGIACGVCTGRVEDANGTTRKRQQTIRKALDRRPGGPTGAPSGVRRGTAICEEGHPWSTVTLRGRNDEVEDAQCPECGRYLIRIGFVQGEYVADVVCVDACKNAKDDVCRCACGGANHGMNLGKLKFVRKKKR